MNCGTIKGHGKVVAENAKEDYAKIKMREEFEVWAEKNHTRRGNWYSRDGGMYERDRSGKYHVRWLQSDFEAWQASREALVIELPSAEVYFDPDDEDYERMEQQECLAMCESHALARCKKAIEAAGVKVKP